MIVQDSSVQLLFGKEAEAIALLKEIVAYNDIHWPAPVPRQLSVSITGAWRRVHFVTVKESLAEHEQQLAEEGAVGTLEALKQKFYALTVPGTGRTELRRVV